ncbi:MAG: SURF1 family protein [Panacagrimonas sp.]
MRPLLLLLPVLALSVAFCALGTWQIHRRVWKLDLIERVERHLRQAPAPAPGPERWTPIGEADAYLAVQIEGIFLHERETLVQALTVEGPGFWVLTPLHTDAGFTVLVNRGFVPPELRTPSTRASGQLSGPVKLSGLLRLSEPGGGFLRRNDPVNDWWYSRDVLAIGHARGLDPQHLAPYFIDADAEPNPGGSPRGGLTVVSFRNNHLVYAITWYGLALLCLTGVAVIVADTRHTRTTRPSL